MGILNSKTVCRIVGWSFLALGFAGITSGHVGTYFQFNPFEAYLSLGLGFISVLGARQRRRVSVLTAFAIGIVFLIWGVAGLAFSHPILGTTEPLDVLVHELAAIWGIGTAIHELLVWRRQDSSTT